MQSAGSGTPRDLKPASMMQSECYVNFQFQYPVAMPCGGGGSTPASLGDSQRWVETALSELTSTTRPSVTSSLATAMLGLHSQSAP